MSRPRRLRSPRSARGPAAWAGHLLPALLAAGAGCSNPPLATPRAPGCANPEPHDGDEVLLHDIPSLVPGHVFGCGSGGWSPAYVVAWKPASSGMATIDAFRHGSLPGVLVEVLQSDCGTGTVCVNGGNAGLTHASFDVLAGRTYLLALGSPDRGDDSTIEAHVQVQPNTVSACRAPSLVDLDAVGVRSGALVSYDTVAPRPAAGSLLAAPLGCTRTATSALASQMVFKYTPRTTGRLFVSTDGPTAFDTVAWVLDRCDLTGTSLGCDDNSGVLYRMTSRLATSRAVTAGVPVYVVVAGVTGTTGSLHVTVGEQAVVPAGGACDATGLANACADNVRCTVGPAAGTTQGLCVADGALGGRCRSGAPACDPSMLCGDAAHGGGADPTRWRCIPQEVAGATCDLYGQADACATGTSCVAAQNQEFAGGRCLADGGNGGRCRPAAVASTACEPGLACLGGTSGGATWDTGARCRPALADGMACDTTGRLNACLAPSRCAITGAAAGTCQPPPYAEQVLTEPAFIDACAAGGAHLAVTDRYGGHATLPVTVPFPVRFAGASFTQLWPSVNGYAVFGSRPPRDTPGGVGSLPNTEAPLLAPLWQHLALADAPASDLCARVVGTAPARQFAIEWADARSAAAPSSHMTFEVVLTEGSPNVDFLYGYLDGQGPDATAHVDGTAATVGLQSSGDAAPTVHVGPVTAASGIRFVPR